MEESLLLNPSFYLAGIPAASIFGVSKGGFGGGLGILSVPLLALVITPAQAASILLPVLCVIDMFGLRAYRNQWDADHLKRLLPGAVIGIVIGTCLFGYLSANFLRLLLGAIAILFTLDFYLRYPRNPGQTSPLGIGLGIAAGMCSGFTSFIAHAGGPPLNLYLLPQRMPQVRYVATTVLFFAVVNFLKLVPYAGLGLLQIENLEAAAILMPFAVAGFLCGIWLLHRIPARAFYHTCYLLVAITGGKLLLDGYAA